MSVLISGSIAYDTILTYDGKFASHLLPDSLENINVTFLASGMVRNFGGCAANIAYSLKMLGGDPHVIGAVGIDGTDCIKRFDSLGIGYSVTKIHDTFTSQCFVTTDVNGSQITTFNPGAMLHTHKTKFPDESANITLAIVSPDSNETMLQRAKELESRGIPFIFDIGQAVSQLKGSEITEILKAATYLAVSDYELKLVSKATKLGIDKITEMLEGLIVTHGKDGVTAHVGSEVIRVPACAIEKEADPVGAGDAFRGGLLYGLSHNMDMLTSLRIGCVMGSFKVESSGAQNYSVSRDEICNRYKHNYGEELQLA